MREENMRVTERLIRQNQKKANRRKTYPEEEETMTYKKRESIGSLNRERGVFDSRFSGINTEKSVFDQTAVFQTGKRNER